VLHEAFYLKDLVKSGGGAGGDDSDEND